MKKMMIGLYGLLGVVALGAAIHAANYIAAVWIVAFYVAFYAAEFWRNRYKISDLALTILLQDFVQRELVRIRAEEEKDGTA